jgi:hypothetical protein
LPFDVTPFFPRLSRYGGSLTTTSSSANAAR